VGEVNDLEEAPRSRGEGSDHLLLGNIERDQEAVGEVEGIWEKAIDRERAVGRVFVHRG
jgi:hypothetical protein